MAHRGLAPNEPADWIGLKIPLVRKLLRTDKSAREIAPVPAALDCRRNRRLLRRQGRRRSILN